MCYLGGPNHISPRKIPHRGKFPRDKPPDTSYPGHFPLREFPVHFRHEKSPTQNFRKQTRADIPQRISPKLFNCNQCGGFNSVFWQLKQSVARNVCSYSNLICGGKQSVDSSPPRLFDCGGNRPNSQNQPFGLKSRRVVNRTRT